MAKCDSKESIPSKYSVGVCRDTFGHGENTETSELKYFFSFGTFLSCCALTSSVFGVGTIVISLICNLLLLVQDKQTRESIQNHIRLSHNCIHPLNQQSRDICFFFLCLHNDVNTEYILLLDFLLCYGESWPRVIPAIFVLHYSWEHWKIKMNAFHFQVYIYY